MVRLTRDGTAESDSRDQISKRERGQGNVNFPCSADHEQDWHPYAVDVNAATNIISDTGQLSLGNCSLIRSIFESDQKSTMNTEHNTDYAEEYCYKNCCSGSKTLYLQPFDPT